MTAAPPEETPTSFWAWLMQDWKANRQRPDSQILLVWFRLAQWAHRRWGPAARLVVMPYWWLTRLVIGIELDPTVEVGPRLQLYHPHSIVVNPGSRIGSDCQLRHGVTIGNRTTRSGRELGIATVGNHVDLGAGCIIIGDLHVGDHPRIGALTVVTESVPPWAVVVGSSSRIVRIDTPGQPASATSESPAVARDDHPPSS